MARALNYGDGVPSSVYSLAAGIAPARPRASTLAGEIHAQGAGRPPGDSRRGTARGHVLLSRFAGHGASLTRPGGAVADESVCAVHPPSRRMTRRISVAWIGPQPEPARSTSTQQGMALKLGMSYCMSVVDLQPSKMVSNRDWCDD